jgi:hypothetical protein
MRLLLPTGIVDRSAIPAAARPEQCATRKCFAPEFKGSPSGIIPIFGLSFERPYLTTTFQNHTAVDELQGRANG